jgi:mannan endo-1,4-beta-mannosidase
MRRFIRTTTGRVLAVFLPLSLLLLALWVVFRPAVPAHRRVTSPPAPSATPVAAAACRGLCRQNGVALPAANDLPGFVSSTGVNPTIVVIYQPFGATFPEAWATEMIREGRTPVIQVDPRGQTMAAIAAGKYDHYLRHYAASVKSFGHPVVLSFGHEMNGNWYDWGCPRTSGQAFIAAWRHWAVLMRQGQSNPQVVLMWTVNVRGGSSCTFRSVWPGSAYVDWVGLDGYLRHPGATFDRIFRPTIATVTKLSGGKPLVIAETGVTNGPDQAKRMISLYSGALDSRVIAVIYFDGEAKKGDYRPQESKETLAAFQSGTALFVSPDSKKRKR